jgi:hypothetical protein
VLHGSKPVAIGHRRADGEDREGERAEDKPARPDMRGPAPERALPVDELHQRHRGQEQERGVGRQRVVDELGRDRLEHGPCGHDPAQEERALGGLSHRPARDERQRQEQRPGPERRPDRQQVEARRNAAVLPVAAIFSARSPPMDAMRNAPSVRIMIAMNHGSVSRASSRSRAGGAAPGARTGSGPSPRPRPRRHHRQQDHRSLHEDTGGQRRPEHRRHRPSLCLPQPRAAIAPMARMMVRRSVASVFAVRASALSM